MHILYAIHFFVWTICYPKRTFMQILFILIKLLGSSSIENIYSGLADLMYIGACCESEDIINKKIESQIIKYIVAVFPSFLCVLPQW